MRPIIALVLTGTACLGTAGPEGWGALSTVASLDAGELATHDGGAPSQVPAPDASVPSEPLSDAGATRDAGPVDAGHLDLDAGPGSLPGGDGGGVGPVRPGPLHGQIPTVTEGPTALMPTRGTFDDTCAVVWNPHAGELLLTVCQVNNLWRYRPETESNQGFEIVRTGGENVFGMQGVAVLPDGAVVVAEAALHRLTISRQGYDHPEPWVAGEFNMPLHLVARSDGNVYFTDPRTESGGGAAAFTALYRVAPDGSVSAHLKNLDLRGLALTYDERTLFVSGENRYGETLLYKVALSADGEPGAAVMFADAPGAGSGAFGLCVDQADNVYHAARRGVRVHDPTGVIIRTIDVPGADDCAFGDADAKTLYVTTSSSLAVYNLYRVRVSVPGLY